MTGRYHPYSEYKSTKNRYFESIPVNWELAQLRRYLLEHKQGYYTTEQYVDSGIKLLRITDLKGDGEIDITSCPKVPETDPTLPTFLLESGDVVFARTGGAGSFGVIRELAEKLVFASYLIRFRFCNKFFLESYLKYMLLADSFQKAVKQNIHGGVNQNIHAEDIKNSYLARPPLDEQQKISDFLDHETAKIEKLIDNQQKLIELLKEKRKAVISHAVTKGLNPDAELKDSGVAWLGKVPEHWVVCCLKHVKGKDKGSFVDGPFGSNLKSEHFVKNGDVYVVESNFATTGRLDFSKLKTISNSHFETISRSETREDCIIIAKIGARYGMNSILPSLDKKAVVSGNSLSLAVDAEKMDVKYCHHLLAHLKREGAMDDGVNVTAQPALSLGQLNNLPFLEPPLSEQSAIVDHVIEQEQYFSSLITKSEKMISLSKERKTALISAAVTGKIDVRNGQEKRELST